MMTDRVVQTGQTAIIIDIIGHIILGIVEDLMTDI